jgi:hypothetical protein
MRRYSQWRDGSKIENCDGEPEILTLRHKGLRLNNALYEINEFYAINAFYALHHRAIVVVDR